MMRPHLQAEKCGTKYVFDDLEFYAYCGFIQIHDNRDGHMQQVRICDFFERAVNLYASAQRETYYDRKMQLVRMAQRVEDCCKEASYMGDLFDPEVLAYKRRHGEFKRQQAVSGYLKQNHGMTVTNSGLLVPKTAVGQFKMSA